MTTNETLSIGFVDISMSTFAYACMVFVSGGNVMTILAISRTESLRTLANIYVISLSLADLIVGLSFGMLGLFMLPPLKDEFFDKNVNMCVFMQGTSIGMVVTSGFHMTLISFDRYIYITKPYNHQRIFTKRNILAILSVIWAFGIFMIFIPQVTHKDVSGVHDCDLTKTLPTWYFYYTNIAIVALTVLVAIFMYSQILMAALRQRKAIQATAVTVSLETENGTGKGHGNKRDVSSNSSKTALKSIKFFFTVFGFYFVCMLPCILTASLYLIIPVHEVIYRIATLVAMLNSGMNFVIYAVLNKQFKQAFADIIKCRPSSQ